MGKAGARASVVNVRRREGQRVVEQTRERETTTLRKAAQWGRKEKSESAREGKRTEEGERVVYNKKEEKYLKKRSGRASGFGGEENGVVL